MIDWILFSVPYFYEGCIALERCITGLMDSKGHKHPFANLDYVFMHTIAAYGARTILPFMCVSLMMS